MAGDLLIGEKLGDYTIESLLGRGGMSRVYLGYDEYLDRYAAVKVISTDLDEADEAEYARRFQTEARAIARLRHPNIVGVYQFGRSAGIYYMAQVLLEGADLRVLLKTYAERGLRVPAPEIARVVRDIASALDYAHEQGVIHRDIKPSNIILERMTGRAILMDFGLALSVPEGTLGDTFGSAHYIAPEQAISSAKAVPQSDLYALGVVVYEMATGTVPFDDPSVMSVALKHLNDPPPPPTVHNPDLPPAVEQAILRALEKDPERRFRTGAAFADALERAYEDAPAHLHSGPSIAELMAWQRVPPGARHTPPPEPAPPEFPEPEPFDLEALASRPTPPPVTSYVPYVPPVPGVASRFAQRRQQKEAEEALRAIAEGDLTLDEDALQDLLRSYDEPHEIGPSGSRPAPIVPPLLAEQAPAEPGAAERARPRRRIRLLLVALILLAAVAAVVVLGTRGDDRASETGGGAGAVALSASETSAPTTPPPSATRAPTATPGPTDSPVAVETQAGAVAVAPTLADSPTETEPPTDTPPPSATFTATPSATPSATPTAAPSATPTASATATLVEGVALEATPGPPSSLRLVYGRDALLLVNVSGGALDVSGLIFEQALADSPARLFRASAWDREGMADSPGSMRDGGCYQVVTRTATQTQPDRTLCPEFLGYVRLESEQRHFWDATAPDAIFTVRLAGADVPLAECAVAAGECGIALEAVPPAPAPAPVPSVMPTARPSPTPVPSPTATPTPLVPDVQLVYDGDQVWLVNVSSEEQDVSGLVFEQLLPDGTVRRFEAEQWNRPDALTSPAQMPGDGCFQLVTGEGTRAAPESVGCARLVGWLRTGVPSRYFWLADDPGAVFTVRRADATAPLATCAIAAGECAFGLAGE
ncbi:MAG: serine/threonine protein kinase [Anaerolineae bacterium]|nr:serine/threonine protein kinase [Anaerolineae bacterium]